MTVRSNDNQVAVVTHQVYIDIPFNFAVNPTNGSKSQSNTGELFPNPAAQKVMFDYKLDVASDVKISIYNSYGKLLNTSVKNNQTAGYYQHKIDVADLSNGLYFLHFSDADKVQVKKFFVHH